jgi:hypothetical protein
MPPPDRVGADDWVTAPTPAAAALAPSPSASAGASDWITAPKQADAPSFAGTTEYGQPYAAPAPDKAAPQSLAAAVAQSVPQGLASGVGGVIAGAGRIAQAGTGPSAQRVLASLDLVDAGKEREAYQGLTDDERQKVAAYRGGGPDDKTDMRAGLQQTIQDYATPNAAMRTGAAIEAAAPAMFPVAAENEGVGTGVGRMIGGVAPAVAAGALGGPPGLLASFATIGSQAYDDAYQDAVSHGATHEQADDAAGKAAVAQAVTMTLPVSRLLQRVPMPLRDGLTKTLVNMGQNGVEFGSANALGTFANNYVASQTYDPDRPLTQGTGRAALEGTIAGLIVPAIGGAMRGGGADAATSSPADIADSVMKAPDIGTAIDAATAASKAMDTTGAVAGPAPTSWGDLFGQPAAEQAQAAPFNPDDPTTYSPTIPGTVSVGPSEAPVPRSAGAAASRDMTSPGLATLSSADMKANRYQSEMAELLAPPATGDKTIYVKGSFPTLAERSGDPAISQQENLIRQRNPGAFIGEGKPLTENNAARVAQFDDETPSRTTLDTMRDDRDAQWNADSATILPNAKPVDFTAASDWVEGQLNDPRIQENDAVRSVLEGFADRLVDNDGKAKTDPAAAWGIHDNLQNQIAKAKDPLNASASEKYSLSQLLAAKKLVDDALNVSTDNQFQTALDNYATASQAINAGVELEKFRPKLTNSSGAIMGERFHNFVVGLATLRGNPGIDPAMSISDGTMRSLINIDTDLKRAGLIKLGSAAGSPTNLLGALAETIGLGGAHAIVGAATHGVGNFVLNAGIKAVAGPMAKYRLDKLTAKHLAPPEGGYTYPEADVLDPAMVAAQRARTGQPPPPPANDTGGSAPAAAPAAGPPPAPATPAPAPAVPVNDTGNPAPAPTRVTTAQVQARDGVGAVEAGRRSAAENAAAAPAPIAASGAGPGASTAYTPSNVAVPVRYTVRDASDLIASQLPDGRANSAFPPELQPRDRTRAASLDQVNSIANQLEPARLGVSASTAEGAPIIGPDGVVESGNARTMAIQRAYAEGGPRADAYRQWVAAQGHDTTGIPNPVLVRERTSNLDMPARARLAADMGGSPVAGMSAPERAAADSRAIPNDTLAMLQGGDVTLGKNAPFARAFAEHVVPPGERANFITADGTLSQDGAARIRNALTQHAYGSNALVASLAEHADPDIKAFGGALMDAAGSMAKLRGLINEGKVGTVSDIAPDIVAAAQLIKAAKLNRVSLADEVKEIDMYSARPEQTEPILQAAFGEDFGGRMSRVKFAAFLSAYAEKAQAQSGLFRVDQTAAQMVGEARASHGYGTKTGTAPNVARSGIGDGPGPDVDRQAVRGPVDAAPGQEDAGSSAAGDTGRAAIEAGEVTPPPTGLINK